MLPPLRRSREVGDRSSSSWSIAEAYGPGGVEPSDWPPYEDCRCRKSAHDFGFLDGAREAWARGREVRTAVGRTRRLVTTHAIATAQTTSPAPT